MRIIMFYHSLLSDWNHGNAHFLRGVVTELLMRGHDVQVYEPESSWSYNNLVEQYGEEAIKEFHDYCPQLTSNRYSLEKLDLDMVLDKSDLVIVHEWNDHGLVKQIGDYRKLNTGFRLLFHDTHHRSVSEPEKMKEYDLSSYDGVLAFGKVIKNIYVNRGWAKRVWVWHEAADVRIFHPYPNIKKEGDLVWIGNWGDEERTKEIYEFFINPSRDLNLKTSAYGVRYPDEAVKALSDAGINYYGWLPNYKVPQVFAAFKVTVHIPRRYYVELLPGIPTIRVFEALACGVPLISAPWDDSENLFTRGKDYLIADNGHEMKTILKELLNDEDKANEIAAHGRKTILKKHTCAHRVDELLDICKELGIKAGKGGAKNFFTEIEM